MSEIMVVAIGAVILWQIFIVVVWIVLNEDDRKALNIAYAIPGLIIAGVLSLIKRIRLSVFRRKYFKWYIIPRHVRRGDQPYWVFFATRKSVEDLSRNSLADYHIEIEDNCKSIKSLPPRDLIYRKGQEKIQGIPVYKLKSYK